MDDISIGLGMYSTGVTYSQDEMDLFFKLTKEFYNHAPEKGDIFLDIGANIGTTSIYVKRVINRDMKVIAFEPEEENFKLLKINAIMNNCDDIITVKAAMSNENTIRKLAIEDRNRMANKIIEEEKENQFDSIETVKSITLDSYIKDNSIDEKVIRYIWLDTEGHEPYVLEGMEKLLSKYRIPIFMEFTRNLINIEQVQRIIDIFKIQYSGFICMSSSDSSKYKNFPLDKLAAIYNSGKETQYNIFLY